MSKEKTDNNATGSQIILYRTEDGKNRIDVRLEDDSAWLTQLGMAHLFQTTKPNVSMHLKNIFKEGELQEISVVKEHLTTAADGKNYVTRFYNLEAILSVGYRVRSPRGVQFRQWATERLREYVVKGFTLDDERLKGRDARADYFDELLARIREIRASEVRVYQRIREIFALASDLPKNPEGRAIGMPVRSPGAGHPGGRQVRGPKLPRMEANGGVSGVGVLGMSEKIGGY